MRKPDFAALREVVRLSLTEGTLDGKPARVDLRTLTNAMLWLANAVEMDHEALGLMALLIACLGPERAVKKGLRNLSIRAKLAHVDRFHTTLFARWQAVAHDEMNLKADRVARIQRGEVPVSPLARFVRSVENEQAPTDECLAAAKEAMRTLGQRLLSDSSKGRQARAQLADGFRQLGASGLAVENYLDVEAALQNGASQSATDKAAIDAVACASGQHIDAVTTHYYSVKKQLQADLRAALWAANEGRVVTDEKTGAVITILPAIRKDDMAR